MYKKQHLELDGESLTSAELVNIGEGGVNLNLSAKAWENVRKSRSLLDQIVAENKVAYGITTGFGKFARVVIEKEKLSELQLNLIRSHAVGVGEPLTLRRTRMLFALRMNVLAKGYSGIGEDTLSKMINIFNASCLPYVPEKGTVGASGDLAPLAHLALGMIGEGKMWSPKTGWGKASEGPLISFLEESDGLLRHINCSLSTVCIVTPRDAYVSTECAGKLNIQWRLTENGLVKSDGEVLDANGLPRLFLKPKEGIALINGTQLITSIGAEALERSQNIARQADVVAALSLEVLRGTSRAFTKEIHAVRPHKGQGVVAARLRALLGSDIHPSQIAESHQDCNRVQDAYTLRCCPQIPDITISLNGWRSLEGTGLMLGSFFNVHGIVNDTIEFVRGILTTELNSATDNPMVFADIGQVISGGNFHGEYPAKALDYLAIGVHEIANMSERRLERLVNPAYSELPAFLVENGGLNSGFMMAQVTAAALVSENKVLCHPSSVDSLTTSAGTEDHVSMGGFAARKAITVVDNVEHTVAIELLAACQGLDLLKPLKTTAPLQAVYNLIRSHISYLDQDRYMAPDIDIATKLLQENKIWETVKPYIEKYNAAMGDETTVSSRQHSPTSSSLHFEPPQKICKM